MTITDLKTYAERVNRKISPDDKFEVTLTRNALTYIGAILRDRKASLEQSLADPKSMKYRLAGNSIVVNVLYHIFKAMFIDDQPQKPRQLSLFDF